MSIVMRTRWKKVACMKRKQKHTKPDFKDPILKPIPMKRICNQVSNRAVVKTVRKLLQKNSLNSLKEKSVANLKVV